MAVVAVTAVAVAGPVVACIMSGGSSNHAVVVVGTLGAPHRPHGLELMGWLRDIGHTGCTAPPTWLAAYGVAV